MRGYYKRGRPLTLRTVLAARRAITQVGTTNKIIDKFGKFIVAALGAVALRNTLKSSTAAAHTCSVLRKVRPSKTAERRGVIHICPSIVSFLPCPSASLSRSCLSTPRLNWMFEDVVVLSSRWLIGSRHSRHMSDTGCFLLNSILSRCVIS